MSRHWLKVAVLLLVVGAVVLAKTTLPDDVLTVDQVKERKEQLLAFIETHYIQAVISFICLYMGTALFLPGAVALTIAGGMMFGTVATAIYANIGGTAGATLAFLAARFVVGAWVQERFQEPLQRFNEELSRHGHNYLLVLRILPLAPFFVVNYCAGITRIPFNTFVWTTSLGMLPGALIYAYLGNQLRHIDLLADLFSWKIMAALAVLCLFALLPVLVYHGRKRWL